MNKMTYIDGFVLVVPKKNVNAYKKMSTQAGKVWKKHGAIVYVEAQGNDLNPNIGDVKSLTFPKMVKLKKDETVWFSFIVYKNKAHRDSVNKKVMDDPFMKDPKNVNMSIPFDIKKMAYGGFDAKVDL
jgi:uncharacterized protein YbaA (DUF1428 family)